MILVILCILAVLLCIKRREQFIVSDAQDIHNYECIKRLTYKNLSNKFDDVPIGAPQYRELRPLGHNYADYINAASPWDDGYRLLSTTTKGLLNTYWLPGTRSSHMLNVAAPVPYNYSFPPLESR